MQSMNTLTGEVLSRGVSKQILEVSGYHFTGCQKICRRSLLLQGTDAGLLNYYNVWDECGIFMEPCRTHRQCMIDVEKPFISGSGIEKRFLAINIKL